jgi:hypothetical protein
MAESIWGVVKDGVVIPDAPLPEGRRVEIVVPDGVPEVPPELHEEFQAWERASANALELVERLAREHPADEKKVHLALAEARPHHL